MIDPSATPQVKHCEATAAPLAYRLKWGARRTRRYLAKGAKKAWAVTTKATSDSPAEWPAWGQALGPKRTLVILARFADEAAAPISATVAQARLAVISDHYARQSYGLMTLAFTVVPEAAMPQPASFYTANHFPVILIDAVTAAKALNPEWDAADYDQYVVVTTDRLNRFSYAGRAYVGTPGCHIDVGWFSLRTLGHELGHNFGLFHSNAWEVPSGASAAARNGTLREYQHLVCGMGGLTGSYYDTAGAPHFDPPHKLKLGWLKAGVTLLVLEPDDLTQGTTERLHAYETLVGVKAVSVNIPAWKDAQGRSWVYWACYRTAYPDPRTRGLAISISAPSYDATGAALLDLSPGSAAGKADSVLQVGGEFVDAGVGLRIKVVGAGEDADGPWLDVQFGDLLDEPVPPPTEVVAAIESLTASQENPARKEGVAQLWDGNLQTKWLAFSATPKLVVKLKDRYEMHGLVLTSGNDFPQRDPVKLAVKSSEDGVFWTPEVILSPVPWLARRAPQTVALPEGLTGRFLSIALISGSGLTQLTELQVLGSRVATTPPPKVLTRLETAEQDADRLAAAIKANVGQPEALAAHETALLARTGS